MSTPFPTLLPPPGPSVLAHPLPPSTSAPDPAIPPAFTEALSVRIAVYVDEQHCSLANEIDADDPRSWHWIVYASVSGPKSHNSSSSTPNFSNGPSSQPQDAAQASEQRRPSGVKLPVATVRLVPPPHALHPMPGSVDGVGGAWPASGNDERRSSADGPTAVHDGHEPYIKLGRLATLEEYRGLGLGKLLVTTTLEWAARNAEALRLKVGEGEGAGLEGEGVAKEREGVVREEGWKGLVLVHAQKGVQGFWRGVGFERDEGLGEWVEEGIVHVGMWRRVRLEGA